MESVIALKRAYLTYEIFTKIGAQFYILMMENRNKIIATLNTNRLEIDGENAFVPLANFLREKECLTGTKIVCAEGDCGACTVLIAREVGSDGKLEFKAVNSCIIPSYLIDGAHIVTVEGLKKDNVLHPVQEAMVECHGAQCGYCTPGFICAMAGLTEDAKNEKVVITEKKARNYLTGNLCRCTGYKPIIEAAISIDLKNVELLKDRFHNPVWIKETQNNKKTPLLLNHKDKSIFIPVKLDQALQAKNDDPGMRLIAGSTDLGVVVNKGKLSTPKVIALYHIDELKNISNDGKFITIGATVTLSECEKYVAKIFPELKKMLHIFASPQIKNQATLVGNIVNASPIADTIPFLLACDAVVVAKSLTGTREILMKDFYLGYKTLNLAANEIVTAIKVPLLKKNESVKLYKVSMRKDLDISAVTFAGLVERADNKIVKARFALGGVAATVIRLKECEDLATDQDFTKNLFEEMARSLPALINPLSDLRASSAYRMKLAQNFFLKFHNELNSGAES